MRKSSFLALLVLTAMSCGRDLDKKTPAVNNGASSNNGAGSNNGVATNNGMTVSGNNGVATNNGTVGPQNNGTAGNNGVTVGPTNNGTIGAPVSIAFLEGEFSDFEEVLNAEGLAYDRVGSDDPSEVLQLTAFFADELPNYDVLIVDRGRHLANLSDAGGSVEVAASFVEEWVQLGGRLIDLSNGLSGGWGFDDQASSLIKAGTYTATSSVNGLPQTFAFEVPAQSFLFVNTQSLPSSIETLAQAEVEHCQLIDINCASPSVGTSSILLRRFDGDGVVYRANLVAQFSEESEQAVLALIDL